MITITAKRCYNIKSYIELTVFKEYFKYFIYNNSLIFTTTLKRFYFLKDFMYLFVYLFILERGREGEREGEKHQSVVASRVPLTRDLAHNPGMCPDWGLNQ